MPTMSNTSTIILTKYKLIKVFAVHSFPKGCGRFPKPAKKTKVFPKPRKVAAVRTYPAGCGPNCSKNVACIEKENKRKEGEEKAASLVQVQENNGLERKFDDEEKKGSISVTSNEKQIQTKEGEEKVENLVQVPRSNGLKRKFDDDDKKGSAMVTCNEKQIEHKKVEEKVGSLVQVPGNKGVKRKFDEEVKNEDEKKKGLEVGGGRVLVQALMAAPNCPWRKGKSAKARSLHSNNPKDVNRVDDCSSQVQEAESLRSSQFPQWCPHQSLHFRKTASEDSSNTQCLPEFIHPGNLTVSRTIILSKRRKVLPNRTFPVGCGPKASQVVTINLKQTECKQVEEKVGSSVKSQTVMV